MSNELVNFWRRCSLAVPPFAHPDDLPILRQNGATFIDEEPTDFDAFIAGPRFGDFADHRLHLSLLPIPYSGDLSRAKIVILLLNPGFSYTDYWAENKMPDLRKRLEDNLRQSFKGVEFPFLWLDPQFCFHSGFVWWEKKLRDVTTAIAEKKFKGRYLEALRYLSGKLACLELVPYHSSSFRAHALIEQLPSVKMAQRFVRESLAPDANAGRRTLIVTRQARAWGLPAGTKNLEIYEGGHTRGASLSTISKGGKAILQRLDIA
jgi:hypothetical protein